MAKRGRKPTFNANIGRKICEKLAEGKTLLAICKEPGSPGYSTIMAWLFSDDPKFKQFQDNYARARIEQAHCLVDQCVEIADDGSNDTYEVEGKDGKLVKLVDYDHIQRSKLRVDTRKWFASKVAAKIYGDRFEEEKPQKAKPETVEMVVAAKPSHAKN